MAYTWQSGQYKEMDKDIYYEPALAISRPEAIKFTSELGFGSGKWLSIRRE
jgi:hypothetical protein